MQNPSHSQPRFVILSAIDGTDRAARVLQMSAKVACSPQAELHLVHVVPTDSEAELANGTFGPLSQSPGDQKIDEGGQYLSRQAASLQDLAQRPVFPHLVSGRPWETVLQLAADVAADLLVVGTKPHGFEESLLGSAAELVVRLAPCPVLVAREKAEQALEIVVFQPACADCLRAQRESRGANLWCLRHSQCNPRTHLHHEMPGQTTLTSGASRR